MAGRSSKADNRGSDLLGFLVSGKGRQFHTFRDAATFPDGTGLTATGGVISDYTNGSTVYRAHIFTSSGTFDVTAPGDFGDTVEYLVVAGGGGGGYAQPSSVYSGGGGAGGLRTNLPGVVNAASSPLTGPSYPIPGPFASPQPYTVIVGSGGAGDRSSPNTSGARGGISEFYPTPVSHPSPTRIRADGGGGGSSYPSAALTGGSGGGGGTSFPSANQAGVSGNTPPYSPPQGNPGGNGLGNGGSPGAQGGGGGGGAGEAGQNAQPPNTGGSGGAGVQVAIAGPTDPTFTGVGAENPGPGEYQWFAGGGGGAGRSTPGPGGVGGGAIGAYGNQSGFDATFSTGGGGGGGAYTGAGPSNGGNGGSGIVVVRYKFGQLTATAKATGGAISFYGGKTIHTFTSSGTFTAPGTFSETCEYVVLGGGASGGACAASNGGGAGGGGAGSYRTGTTPISGPSSTSIQVGAGGASPNTPGNAHGTVGTPSYFGTPITAPTGGYGAMADGSPKTGGGPGGSGGGGGGGGSTGTNANAGPSTGASFPGTIGSSPTAGWGHDGGAGVTAGQGYSGGGGGGAGGGGVTGTSGTNSKGGNGGLGIQLPSSFRNPSSTVGHSGPTSPSVTGADTSGKYYVAGGGGGGVNPLGGGSPDKGYGGVGPGTTTDPFAGAGNAGKNAPGSDATENSGSGGGGTGGDGAGYSGNGGSGIVLIAYPS